MKVFLLLLCFCCCLHQQLYSQSKVKEYTFEDVMQVATRVFFSSDEDSVRGIKTSICDNNRCFVDSEKAIDIELKKFCFQTVENDMLRKQESQEVEQVFKEYTLLCKKIAKMN